MVGTYQVLEVRKILSFGAILGDEEILLPAKYIPNGVSLGECIRVFIYTDSEDRLIATTLEPFGVLGQIVCLEVVDIVANGAYLDFGLAKDIFMPCKRVLTRGEKVVVQIKKDKQGRLLASLNLEFVRFLGNKKGLETMAIAYQKTPLGFLCVVEGRYSGMIYHNEIFSPIILGENIKVRIKNVRKDGKLDLKLVQRDGKEILLEVLKQNNGRITLNSDSKPEEIYKLLSMSKKTFKKALNALAEKIGQDEEGSYLLP